MYVDQPHRSSLVKPLLTSREVVGSIPAGTLLARYGLLLKFESAIS